MRRHFSFSAACAAIVIMAACGGKQSMASKSANAYRDAVARGIPVAAGGHGGHMATPAGDSSAMPGMDHGSMAGMDMSQSRSKQTSAMAGKSMS